MESTQPQKPSYSIRRSLLWWPSRRESHRASSTAISLVEAVSNWRGQTAGNAASRISIGEMVKQAGPSYRPARFWTRECTDRYSKGACGDLGSGSEIRLVDDRGIHVRRALLNVPSLCSHTQARDIAKPRHAVFRLLSTPLSTNNLWKNAPIPLLHVSIASATSIPGRLISGFTCNPFPNRRIL